MSQTTINLSNKEIGNTFFLLDAHKCCWKNGKPGCIEYIVVSTKDFRKYLIKVFGQDIVVPEPSECQLVQIVFEDLEFYLWDFDDDEKYEVIGLAEKVIELNVINI